MNQDNKSPLQREFEQSGTYRVLKEVGGKVVRELNHAGINTETVNKGIYKAAEGINRAVDRVNREINNAQAKANPKPPVQTASQNQTGYKSAPPVQPAPQKPKMEMRRRPSNVKFWLTGAVCALRALTGPLLTWNDLVGLAVLGVVTFLVSRMIFKGKKYYVPVEAPKPEPVKKPEPKPVPEKPVNTGDPEVDKIITEGYAYLEQLKTANDRIEDDAMSLRIARMEAAAADIFAYIAENPEQAAQIRRFMNYYLPTTLKLLTSYDKLSRQRVKGETIRKTMFEIEGMTETIAAAFEKQLDSLFRADAMDIAADISVMESILQQEGLSGENGMPKV